MGWRANRGLLKPPCSPRRFLAPLEVGPWSQVGADSGQHRFWELLWRASSTARWSLVTPPGVQDNGGLSIAQAPRGVLTAGFLPSINLHFSPLARTLDHGASWSPELLPDGLTISPDSLAAGPDQGSLR